MSRSHQHVFQMTHFCCLVYMFKCTFQVCISDKPEEMKYKYVLVEMFSAECLPVLVNFLQVCNSYFPFITQQQNFSPSDWSATTVSALFPVFPINKDTILWGHNLTKTRLIISKPCRCIFYLNKMWFNCRLCTYFSHLTTNNHSVKSRCLLSYYHNLY